MNNKTLLSIILTLCSITFFGQIVHVPADYSTIQAGIDAATDGDTVLVADGTYLENINFKGKAITVASHFLTTGDPSHKHDAIIKGNQPAHPDSGSVVTFSSGEDTTSILYGFTITNGTGTVIEAYGGSATMGGGILCHEAGAKILENKIINNSVVHDSMAGGGGIGTHSNHGDFWLVVENNEINYNMATTTQPSDNWTSAYGGGIFGSTNARINNNDIQYNECHSTFAAQGGGLEFSPQVSDSVITVYITNNTIIYNILDGPRFTSGGGINNYHSKMIVTGNKINDNSLRSSEVAYGGGFYSHDWYEWNSDSPVVLENNEFVDNEIKGSGIGHGAAINFHNYTDKIEIRNNVIVGNEFDEAFDSYGTINIWNWSQDYSGNYTEIVVDGNYIINNKAKYGGGISIQNQFNSSVANNLFLNNSAITGGGAIYLKQTSFKSSGGEREDSGTYIANNNFLLNQAETSGGAIFNRFTSSNVATFNNIFWLNSALYGKDIQTVSNDPMLISYSIFNEDNIQGNWTGDNNVNLDPELAEDMLHIATGSPAYNAGTDELEHNGITYYCPVTDLEGDERPMYGSVDIGADEYFVVRVETGVADDRQMMEVYPNPFRLSTSLKFSLDEKSHCVLKVYSVFGNEVATLFDRKFDKGEHIYKWNNNDLPNGIYHLRLQLDNKVITAKVLHLK